jgi:purine-binding chemotaxis protein CheW
MNDDRNNDTTRDLYLIFETDNEKYALNVLNVIEIIPMCNITFVPEVPNYIKGIINLRGDVVPVIDVRTKFEKPPIDTDTSTCIVQITCHEYVLGIIVDKVIGTLTIPEEAISPPPSAKLRFSNKFVKNVGRVNDEVYLLLDLENLVF